MKNARTELVSKVFLYACVCVGILLWAPVSEAKEEVKFVSQIKADFEQPVDVDISDVRDIYVLDKKLSRIAVFDQQGEVKLIFGASGSGKEELNAPESLALSLKEEIIVADTGNSRVQVFHPNGDFSYQIGNYGTKPGEFRKPNCVAVNPSGYIFVADRRNKTISQFTPNGVFVDVLPLEQGPDDIIFDRHGNLYVLFSQMGKIVKYVDGWMNKEEIMVKEKVKNLIMNISHLSVDHRGDIYLIEKNDHRIIKINQDSRVVFTFGSKGLGRGQFDVPLGIVVDTEDRIYIADSKNQRVQTFDLTGIEKNELPLLVYKAPILEYDSSIRISKGVVDLDYIPGRGLYALSDYNGNILFIGDNSHVLANPKKEDIKLRYPQAMDILSDGRLIVADTGHNRMNFIDSDGTHLYHFGVKGNDFSQFNALQGIVADREGYIYIADTNNHRIQIFNNDGIFLKSFGQKSTKVKSSGAKPETFLNPKDLVFNSKDELFVLDYGNRRIQIFNRDGKFLREIGGVLDAVRFIDPVDLDIDEKNYLYVADRGAHSVYVFDAEGQMVQEFGSLGTGPSCFPKLSAVSGSGGKIYVSNYEDEDVKVFQFLPAMPSQEEYLFLTRTSNILDMDQATDEIRKAMSRKLTMASIKKEFVEMLNVTEEDFIKSAEIESENELLNGQLRITVKMPRSIIPSKYEVVGM